MSADAEENAIAEFMLAEYEDLYQNVIHLENKLFNHLSFYTTLFMGIVTASIAILQLVENTNTLYTRPKFLALLSLLFGLFLIVGRFELRITTEIRARKIKFIEGITQIRQYFVDKDNSVAQYLILPVGLQKAPPYLRVRSRDWYQVIYISLMNGFAVLIAWLCPLWLLTTWITQNFNISGLRLVLIVLAWLFVGVILFYVVFWELSYRSVMHFCESYDKWREEKTGTTNKYDLFSAPLPQSRLRWTFGDWVSWIEKKRG